MLLHVDVRACKAAFLAWTMDVDGGVHTHEHKILPVPSLLRQRPRVTLGRADETAFRCGSFMVWFIELHIHSSTYEADSLKGKTRRFCLYRRAPKTCYLDRYHTLFKTYNTFRNNRARHFIYERCFFMNTDIIINSKIITTI